MLDGPQSEFQVLGYRKGRVLQSQPMLTSLRAAFFPPYGVQRDQVHISSFLPRKVLH